MARSKSTPAKSKAVRQRTAGIRYHISVSDPHAHLYDITLTIQEPVSQQPVRLPVWIAGSYLIREFSQHLQGLQASQNGKRVAVEKLSKSEWRVDCKAGIPLTLTYRVYALDASVRTAWLDHERGFFNFTSLALQVPHEANGLHEVCLDRAALPKEWKVATGLKPVKADKWGWGTYTANDYDELVDSPVTLGNFWESSFKAGGATHRFVITGAPDNMDGERLLADTQRIVKAQMAFWQGAKGKAPYSQYVFMLHASGDGYGGLEHRNSTALICARKDLPTRSLLGAQPPQPLRATDGYVQLLGLISHEFFHTWNVKRLRPQEFARYDYQRENYTRLLWFFEGFTSYFDDRFLVTTGLISRSVYLQLLTKTVRSVEQTPGQLVQSVEEASFDAWIKYYRPNDNTPNATVNYYTKGALVALCLDSVMRAHGHTLSGLMRDLYHRTDGGPMQLTDVVDALMDQHLEPVADWLQNWVSQAKPLPVAEALQRLGVKVSREPSTLATQLGLRVKELAGSSVVTHVLRNTPAERWGLQAGDEIWSVTVGKRQWRVRTLQDIHQALPPSGKFACHIVRDREVLTLQAAWPLKPDASHLQSTLGIEDEKRVQAWLSE